VTFGILIAGLLLACGAIASAGSDSYVRTDFRCFRTAGQLVLEGRDPYDAITWASTAAAPIPLPGSGETRSPCTGAAFAYPLWTALAMAPFAALPVGVSATVWIALAVGAVAWGTRWSWAAFGGGRPAALLCGVLIAFSQPLWLVLKFGQITAVELGVLGLTAWSVTRRQEHSAGVAFAALALKPQLVLLAWAAVLLEAIRRRRRAFLAAASSAAIGIAAASLIVQPAWPTEWLGAVLGPRLRIAALLPTVWGLANDTLGSPLWGAVLALALVGALAVILRGVAVDRAALLALGIGVSLFVSPHVWSYDHLLLALPWAATLAIAVGHRTGRGRLLVVATILGASFAPWVAYAVSIVRVSETLSAAIPAMSALLLATALRLRRDPPSGGAAG